MDVDHIPMTPLVHEKNIKKRRSFFVPSDGLDHEESDNNSTEIKYIEKIKTEEKQWKQLYEESKEKHKELLKKSKDINTQVIDYDTLDPEDIEFLNNRFDLEHFVKQAERIQDLLKIANIQKEHISKRKTMLMAQIDDLSSIFDTEFCNKI